VIRFGLEHKDFARIVFKVLVCSIYGTIELAHSELFVIHAQKVQDWWLYAITIGFTIVLGKLGGGWLLDGQIAG
jgi:hypothetical protein